MRRHPFALLGLLLLVGAAPLASAGWTASWSFALDDGYITTTPQTDGTNIFLRSSGFWVDEARPEVVALNGQGEVQWRVDNPNATQHDMSPLLHIKRTSGDCGNSGPSLLVGWSDGRLERLDPSNGTSLWSITTEVDVWGITGSIAKDGDHVVVSTRTGLLRVCVATGEVNFSASTGLGWRNGPTVTEEGFWQGDEAGRLWHVDRNGSATVRANFSGYLRHPPVVAGDHLLLHVQHAANSTLMAFNRTSNLTAFIASSGPSPALPLRVSGGALFGDSNHLTSVRCEATCWLEDRMNATTNGAMKRDRSGALWFPINTPEGGWTSVDVSSNLTFGTQSTLLTSVDTYGTAAPLFIGERMYLGNDAGVLLAHEVYYADPPPFVYDPAAAVGGAILAGVMVGLAVLVRRTSTLWGWRGLSAVTLVLALMMLPDAVREWNAEAPVVQGPVTAWNETWPQAWRDGHVLIVEFEDRTLMEGGYAGPTTVEALTRQGAGDMGLSFEIQDTVLGPYLTAFDGQEGYGWEYFVNGERVPLSIADAELNEPSIVHWRLASAR